MTGRQSLITPMLILYGPGDLFLGIAMIIRRISEQVTGLKLNCSSAG